MSTTAQMAQQLRQKAEALLLPGAEHIPLAMIAGALQEAADELDKLRKIAAFVPARVYIEAKAKAGFPTPVRPV